MRAFILPVVKWLVAVNCCVCGFQFSLSSGRWRGAVAARVMVLALECVDATFVDTDGTDGLKLNNDAGAAVCLKLNTLLLLLLLQPVADTCEDVVHAAEPMTVKSKANDDIGLAGLKLKVKPAAAPGCAHDVADEPNWNTVGGSVLIVVEV